MKIYKNSKYLEDIDYVAELELPWYKLQDKSILISGATGLIGSFLVDALVSKNKSGLNCKIYMLGRDAEKAEQRFHDYWNNLHFIKHDINQDLLGADSDVIDYIVHLASNTHPVAYATDPIGTIETNIIGTRNLLEFAVSHNSTRIAFASSNEIYGENRGDVELFDEQYCGYINCNTMRAGYPESKRCGEALCQAYITQKNLDIVIPRLTRSYGPTVSPFDSKAINQFLFQALKREAIVLKSTGMQYYSFTYVADAVSGLLTVLLKGEKGEAYNIADIASDITLKDLAHTIADITGTTVVFDNPNAIEAAGYSKVSKSRLDGHKIQNIGWTAKYDIRSGLKRTLSILSEIYFSP